jgi:hypothetical protein
LTTTPAVNTQNYLTPAAASLRKRVVSPMLKKTEDKGPSAQGLARALQHEFDDGGDIDERKRREKFGQLESQRSRADRKYHCPQNELGDISAKVLYKTALQCTDGRSFVRSEEDSYKSQNPN